MADFLVTTTAQTGFGSITEAINQIRNGETITFDDSLIDEQTGVILIELSSQLNLPSFSFTIEGSSYSGSGATLKTRVVFDAQLASRCLINQTNGTKTINGVTFKNGKAPSGSTGGGVQNQRALVLNNCVFDSCTTTNNNGGGLSSVVNGSNSTLNNCLFTNCTTASESNYGGGVMLNNTGEVILNNCAFVRCNTNEGCALAVRGGQATINDCSFVPLQGNQKSTIYIANGTTLNVDGENTVDILNCSGSSIITFSGVDSILAVTTTATIGSATFTTTADSTGYLALPDGTTLPTVGTGIKVCTYGADIESASVSATVVSWTAETLSTPILIEQLSGDSWNTLTDAATGGTYSGSFGEGITVRLFDGVNFYYASRQAPYWLVNSFAVNASNGWIVDASAVATNGGGGTDPVTGDPLPYWTITTDDITPNF